MTVETQVPSTEKPPKLCYCELSGDYHVIINGKCCELCDEAGQQDFTPELVADIFKALQWRTTK